MSTRSTIRENKTCIRRVMTYPNETRAGKTATKKHNTKIQGVDHIVPVSDKRLPEIASTEKTN